MNPNNYPSYENRPRQQNYPIPNSPFLQLPGAQLNSFNDPKRRPPLNLGLGPSTLDRQKMKNGMYSSTIQFNKPIKNFTSLETMGRFVAADSDKTDFYEPQDKGGISNIPKYQKQTMASSTIFQLQAKQQLDRFPAFNLHIGKKPSLTKNTEKEQQIPQDYQKSAQTPQQRRKRQIQTIKLDIQQMSKRVGKLNKPTTFEQTSNTNFTPKTDTIFPSHHRDKNFETAPSENSSFQRKSNNSQTTNSNLKSNPNLQNLDYPSKRSQELQQSAWGSNNNQSIGEHKRQQSLMASSSTVSSFQGAYNHIKQPIMNGQKVFKKKSTPHTIEDLYSNGITNDRLNHPQEETRPSLLQMKVSKLKRMQTLEGPPSDNTAKFYKSDFMVIKKLGKGQFGEVMLVQHKKSGFLCGMKVMQKKQIREEKYAGQIARQLSIQFYLAHRHIAPLYGYFSDQENVYLLVEFCPDGQLLQKLRKDRRMEEQDTSVIVRQILEGVDFIHREYIIHRDIKPENILFNHGVVKICDFGWAVYRGQGMRKTASGSPLYYSPEIVNGDEYDQKIDIWDIGMMTYQCLLGKIPFKIYSELDLKRIVSLILIQVTDDVQFPDYVDVTDQAKDFILRTLKKKPEDRMQIREMLRHPFIAKYKEKKLPLSVMEDISKVIKE